MSDMAYIMETQDPRELWLVEGENKFKVSRDMYWLLASQRADLPQVHDISDLLAEKAKLCKERDTLTHRIDELCMENEQLRNQHTAKRIVVSESGVGHAECGACRGAIDQDDAWCRHCGARLEDS